MPSFTPKLTTIAACEVARIDRDRFNEHVAAGNFPCAPETTAGKARAFDPGDTLALSLFKRFMDDGIAGARAGHMACSIARLAKQYPDARIIAYVLDYFNGPGIAYLPEDVPTPDKWDTAFLSGTDIREVRYYRIGKERDMIAHYTAEQAAIYGPRD